MPREGSRRQDARLRLYQLELHQPAGKETELSMWQYACPPSGNLAFE